MKVAYLYVRVSTDEQADKGYSQRNQDEMLRRYCSINSIEIRKVIFEDHSAKTFNRPEWNKLLVNLKKYKNQCNLILFTKWDRFSRNSADAYLMIKQLRKLGVEPEAIEQPLDMSIPENKMMLAFYLATPEVENDRRALNTYFGMRRAKKEGRYMGTAPVGYINVTDPSGKKYIKLDELQAGIMKWAFEKLREGTFNAEQIYKQAREKGLKCTKSNFWVNIRNPLYCGKIFIPRYKDEESHFVKGQHEPLISETIFYDVQDVLDGRKRKYRPKIVANKILPLRGFLICPHCNKFLTGSKSKGRSQDYFYYHCYGGCKCRFSAEEVNKEFLKELKKYIPKPGVKELLQEVILEEWYEDTKHEQIEKAQILSQIKDLEQRLAYSRDLLSSQKMEPDDFRLLKIDINQKLEKLEAKLAELPNETESIDTLLAEGVSTLFELENLYDGPIENKREVIGSMYPENLLYDGFFVRTARINEAASIIYSLGGDLAENKTGQNGDNSTLSCMVTSPTFSNKTQEMCGKSKTVSY